MIVVADAGPLIHLSFCPCQLPRGPQYDAGMQTPPQIAFHQVTPTAELQRLIDGMLEGLERYCDHIVSARVVVEQPHRRQHKGRHVSCRVTIEVPGAVLVADSEPDLSDRHADPFAAVRDTFDDARRQLQDYVRQHPGRLRPHPPAMPLGRVARLFRVEGYGFLEAEDGHEVYFHENSLVDGRFEDVRIGDAVRFVEEEGLEGPQASTVHVVRSRRPEALPGRSA